MIRWSLVEPFGDRGNDPDHPPDAHLDGGRSSGLPPRDRWIGEGVSGGPEDGPLLGLSFCFS